MLLKIGDFARLGQVSVVTLRHYDEIGLLKPLQVDPSTGYRYYSAAQLHQLNRILMLKDLGFSLDQVEQVLEGLTTQQLQGMLVMKQLEAQHSLASEQDRLARIRVRLKQIEQEEIMTKYDVLIKTVPSQLIASCRVTIPTNDQVPAYLTKAYGEVYKHIREQRTENTGPCFAVWHQSAAVLAGEVAEAVVPVAHRVASSRSVKVYELPEAEVAFAVHQGEVGNFAHLHAALLDWIEANNYLVIGPYREIYRKSTDDSDSATEIQYPVAKAS